MKSVSSTMLYFVFTVTVLWTVASFAGPVYDCKSPEHNPDLSQFILIVDADQAYASRVGLDFHQGTRVVPQEIKINGHVFEGFSGMIKPHKEVVMILSRGMRDARAKTGEVELLSTDPDRTLNFSCILNDE